MSNLQASKKNLKISSFRRIPMRSSTAYINQFLALPKAMYNYSV